MADLTRLRKELVDCKTDEKVTGVSAIPRQDNNMRALLGTIKGPIDSPYEGGVFSVDIQIPSSYPFEPPKMKFITKIWHPNISSQTGAICLDILKDQWSPALTIKTALVSLQALLSVPEPNDPQDAQVASQYLKDKKAFEETAKNWTDTYATNKGLSDKIQKLTSMGFDQAKVEKILQECHGDENIALERLLAQA